MSRPDEGLIHTYLDGECTAEEAAFVERMMATDAQWSAAVAEARGLIAASSRIVAALDVVPGGVVPSASSAPASSAPASSGGRAGAAPRRVVVRNWMRVAAGLVLVAGTAYVVSTSGGDTALPTPASVASADATREAAAGAQRAARPGEQGLGQPARGPESPTAELERPSRLDPIRAEAAGRGARLESIGESPNALASASVDSTTARAASEERGRLADAAAGAASGVATGAATGAAPTAVATAAATAASDPAARAAAAERSKLAAPMAARIAAPAPAAPAARDVESDAPSLIVPRRLEDCYLVSAPDSLRGFLRNPIVVRQARDTVTLQLDARRQVTVVLVVDGLRGALTATRVPCTAP